MISDYRITTYIITKQNEMYNRLNNFSEKNILCNIAGRFLAIPVSIIDIGLETSKAPINVIESVASAIMHLFGAAFSDDRSLKNALKSLDVALGSAVKIPVKLVTAPLKIVFQLAAAILFPDTVLPFCQEETTL